MNLQNLFKLFKVKKSLHTILEDITGLEKIRIEYIPFEDSKLSFKEVTKERIKGT